METPSHEVALRGLTPEDAYEQITRCFWNSWAVINGRLATKRRTDVPRGWEHIGEQDEIMAMLLSVADYLGA